MALARVHDGYMPTNEALIGRVKTKNLTQYNPGSADSIVVTLRLILKDFIREAQLIRVVKIEVIESNDLLRNNWGRKGATDAEIARMKVILHTERGPAWFPLYCQD